MEHYNIQTYTWVCKYSTTPVISPLRSAFFGGPQKTFMVVLVTETLSVKEAGADGSKWNKNYIYTL